MTPDDRFDEALGEYMRRIDQGEAVDRDEGLPDLRVLSATYDEGAGLGDVHEGYFVTRVWNQLGARVTETAHCARIGRYVVHIAVEGYPRAGRTAQDLALTRIAQLVRDSE